MKTARQSTRNYWINFGKRAAASGMSLESITAGLKPEAKAVRELMTQGHAAELKRKARLGHGA